MTLEPDWPKIEKIAEDMYNILNDESKELNFLEIDCILTLLNTQCNTNKYIYIVNKKQYL